jgi:hypothetical protein
VPKPRYVAATQAVDVETAILTQFSQAAAQKKNNANANNAGATPAAEPTEAMQEGPPATPITPVNPASFAKNQAVNAGQVAPNGQPPVPAPQQQAPPPVPPPSHPDPNQATNFLDTAGMVRTPLPHIISFGELLTNMTSPKQDFNLDFSNPMQTEDVLNAFDFDSFLHDNPGAEDGEFQFSAGFSMEGDTSVGATD